MKNLSKIQMQALYDVTPRRLEPEYQDVVVIPRKKKINLGDMLAHPEKYFDTITVITSFAQEQT